ncbi:hypothetical protein ACER0A_001595 [Haloimpatiens sp. FM7315]|uniref:hypothetical protein n=1 Tax=Haloimpatiens sp. FM7315 TaxID=3298609 RepID=UPI00370AA1CB
MKKNKFFMILLIIFSLAFLTSGCNTVKLNSSEKITAPDNKVAPIQGTWKVTSYHSFKNQNSEEMDSYIGILAKFNPSFASFNDELCKTPSYKVKTVDTDSYFIHNFKVNYKDLGITTKNIQIISVNTNDTLFYDFIRIDENKIVVYVNDAFFSLTKISDTTKNLAKLDSGKEIKDKSKSEDCISKSGVFIALRKDSDNINSSPSSYKTIWICSINKKLEPLLETPGIFVPRKTGFWTIDSNRISSKGYVKDTLNAYSLDSATKINGEEKSKETNIKENLFRKINFIGNDFICTEFSNDKDNLNTLNKFKVLPIDSLDIPVGIKISHLVGDKGKQLLSDSLQSYFSLHADKKELFKNQNYSEENYTVLRKNGHWVMKGRLNSSSNMNDYIDFDLNIFPPKKLLNYDDLYLSWNSIKSRVPAATDAFTSPNNDFALIVCNEYIYIYEIKNGVLSTSPMNKIKLNKNESIIMAEWATGNYTERWRDSFKSFLKKTK